jgi:hypothetical protein
MPAPASANATAIGGSAFFVLITVAAIVYALVAG